MPASDDVGMDEHTVTQVYFRVPNFTGYGPDFKTWDEAYAECRRLMHSEFVRVFIDVRELTDEHDAIVKRYEVTEQVRAEVLS